jgi:hypothetical protein
VSKEPGRHGMARFMVSDSSLLLSAEDLILFLKASDHL